jgi:hypothetical protein
MRAQGVIRKAAFIALGIWATQAFGQGLGNGSVSSIFNSRLASSLPHADTVPVSVSQTISQIADGAGWKTTIILANADTVPADFTLQFWSGDGSPLSLSIGGQGMQQVSGEIPVNGTMTIKTDGTSANLSQGWGQLTTSNLMGGTAIFRQSVPGRPDFEAAVPITKPTSQQLIMPYDNTSSFATAFALVNPDPSNTATINVNVFDPSGNLLNSGVLTLPPQGQQGFVLPTLYPPTANQQGLAVLWNPNGGPLTGLGLRFNPGGSFTSIQMMTPSGQ